MVLVPYYYETGGDPEWCRGWVEHHHEDKSWVTVFLQDYGHRTVTSPENLRRLSDNLKTEPTFCKELVHQMPCDDFMLKTIRSELGNKETTIFARIEKVTPKAGFEEEVMASFWKAVENSENNENDHSGIIKLSRIC